MLNSEVTVVIPFKHNTDWLDLSVKMWLAQHGDITIHVLDTENQLLNSRKPHPQSDDVYTKSEWLFNHPKIEVAHLGLREGKHHPSDPVAIAYDFAFSRCLSRYILTTHVDVFPKHRDVVSVMISNTQGGLRPAVGWEMSKRGFPAQMLKVFHDEGVAIPPEVWDVYNKAPSPSDGVIGMVCSLFDVAAMDRICLTWSLRRCHHMFGTSRGATDAYGWPDTETASKFFFDKAGVVPRFLGRETNFENQETDHWIHARSMTLDLLPRHQQAFDQAKAIYESWGI